MMKTLIVNRKIYVSIITVLLLVCGVQSVSYSQTEGPTVTPGETNTSMVVRFQITLDEEVSENAYQVQLRQKSPQGEWISKCVVIKRGNRFETAGDPDVSASAIYISGVWLLFSFTSGDWSDKTFNIKAIFTELEPGTTYEARYRDTNHTVCVENPPSPDPWSEIGEGTTHLVTLPRSEFVDANLAKAVRLALGLDTVGGHIDLLKIPKAKLVQLTGLEADDAAIMDLTGLEHATQLASLDLSDNHISDIAPLTQLTQLTELNLENNEITHITPLAQLTQLSLLLLRGNPIGYPITDTSPLVQLLRENPWLDISIDIPIFTTASGGGPDLYLISDDSIQRVSLVKTYVQDIVSELRFPRGIALDVAGGKMYWTNAGFWTSEIQRTNLEGSTIESIFNEDELDYPKDIALDVAGGKIYWTNAGFWANEDKIQRANLDGTNVQDIVTGLEGIGDIALDVADGKIYWTDRYGDKIQRANLDGTNVQDIVTGLRRPEGIALDVAGGKIYWTDRYWINRRWTGKIQRANLDGTNVQDIVAGLREPQSIALDVAGDKMYWTEKKEWEDDNDEEWSTYKIQRADLDGTNVENVVSGLRDIEDIALSSTVRDIPDSDSRTAFESSVLSRYTRVTLSNEGRVYGVPTKYSDDAHLGTVAYMLLAKLKGCDFATAELIRQSKVYIKTQELGRLRNFASETVCGVTSREYSSSWDGSRITHIRYYDENSSPNIQEAIYNAATGQYDLDLAKITGPWLWMIAPTEPRRGGSHSINVDSLAAASAGAVTEAEVVINGAKKGDTVGDYAWKLGEIAAIGRDNINYLLNSIGMAQGNIDNHSSYALITLESATAQSGVPMLVGSDDAIKVWLNGKVVYNKPIDRGASDFQDYFTVDLEKGDNLLLVKVSEGGGLWSMFVGIEADVNAVYKRPPDAVVATDVNGDGIVNIQDLVLVSSNLGQTGKSSADVNGDSVVNITDLVLVAGALGTSAAAPSLHSHTLEMLTATEVKQWLSEAQQLDLTDTTFQRGILFLQQLLIALTPKETVLLANYPNPFNPETWIPYHLAKDANVTLHIYAVNGTLVRTLSLGHQAAGMYQSRSRAAYWDGRNALSESVASGVYFYTLTADNFSATRKMLILK